MKSLKNRTKTQSRMTTSSTSSSAQVRSPKKSPSWTSSHPITSESNLMCLTLAPVLSSKKSTWLTLSSKNLRLFKNPWFWANKTMRNWSYSNLSSQRQPQSSSTVRALKPNQCTSNWRLEIIQRNALLSLPEKTRFEKGRRSVLRGRIR